MRRVTKICTTNSSSNRTKC
ncbi:hypothetical protein JGH11_16215 [Dysgonomonas sp. Marseille-P4677]|nr:hypothetical protein [Dysgonomonas sp. Marseille-P4677]